MYAKVIAVLLGLLAYAAADPNVFDDIETGLNHIIDEAIDNWCNVINVEITYKRTWLLLNFTHYHSLRFPIPSRFKQFSTSHVHQSDCCSFWDCWPMPLLTQMSLKTLKPA
ncbi:hypothetical protein CEXT_294341 [Caerostris extrusa]|uniref:Uncharacterized protein n=1 Tax=Caerostris extrusa TaxID=172846 RepID=A0AAV4NV84_CAEEX|nr:hypothetical protein CEXT_294341 [Caerostris extrusa]